jgi:hypothetical protein
VFGMEDELKVAPKGVDKGHKCVFFPFLVLDFLGERLIDGCQCRDIDLLKCRSFAMFR